jgi:hypothetical protein
LKYGQNKIIIAILQDRLYVIIHIKHGYQNNVFFGQGYHDISYFGEIINGTKGTKGTTNELTASEKENYLLWHQLFNHLGPDKIRNLHKVTNLSLPIKVPTKLDICEVWILTKMTNRIPKQLTIHKSKCLELIYLDIVGPFPQSIRSNCYFILIIDSYTKVNWIILLKYKSDAIAHMKTWMVKVDLAIGDKIITLRTDNAADLI